MLDPDLMLVPLAAFDRPGGRIGYGRGYYDTRHRRAAAKGRAPVLVGVAFACQEAEAVPMEPHDVRLPLDRHGNRPHPLLRLNGYRRLA